MKLLFIIPLFFFASLKGQNATLTAQSIVSTTTNLHGNDWCSHGDWGHNRDKNYHCSKQWDEMKAELNELKKKVAKLEEEIKLKK